MFTHGFGRYACEGDTITATIGEFELVATIYRDDCNDRPDERHDGFWPSKDPKAAGYVEPDQFDAEMAKAMRVMKAWENDEWFYCGIAVTVYKADVRLTHSYGAALWGIECNYPDSDNSYLLEVANELAPEAIEQARAKLRALAET